MEFQYNFGNIFGKMLKCDKKLTILKPFNGYLPGAKYGKIKKESKARKMR